MYTIWCVNRNLAIVFLTLFWCCVRLQTCSNSTTQTTIKMNFYTNGSDTIVPSDLVIDSTTMNQYFVHSYFINNQNVHVTQIYSNGSYGWSKEYDGFIIKSGFKSAQISSDGASLFMIGQGSASA